MRMVKLLLAAGFVWSLFWAVGAWGLRNDIAAWFIEQSRQGWMAEHAGLSGSGYPLLHETHILNPALADPGTGVAWRGDRLLVQRSALSPSRVILHFPASPQQLSHFDKTIQLSAKGMVARLDLAAGSAMSLNHLHLQSGPWKLSRNDSEFVSAPAVQIEVARDKAAKTYQITAHAKALHLRGSAQGFLAPNRELADLEIQAKVGFDAEWDRRSIELRRPQPRRIELELAQARWETRTLKATGTIEMDERGQATGRIALQARNWRELLQVAETSGLLPAPSRGPAERLLGLLATVNGQREDLEVTLTLEQGHMFLGPVPLGPVPRILLP